MKNFTSFADADDYKALLQQALEIKANPYGYQHIGRNKTVGLIFFNPSLRTRLSSVKAAYNLGGIEVADKVGQHPVGDKPVVAVE